MSAAKQAAAAAYRPEWQRRKAINPSPGKLVHTSVAYYAVMDDAGKVTGYRPTLPKGRTLVKQLPTSSNG